MPEPDAIAEAAAALMSAKRPMIYTGGGVIMDEAWEELRQLVRKLGYPITQTLMGLGAYPGTDKQFIGMLANLNYGPNSGEAVVCAGYPGEHHELGLMSVAIKLALRGLKVTCLGADLPLDELVNVVNTRPVGIACTSIMNMGRDPANLLASLRDLRAKLAGHTVLVVGGRGVFPLVGQEPPGVVFCPTWADFETNFRWATVRSLPGAG